MNITYPLVSVVIPSYNHESYVKECINGVVNQSYRNIELIIIDDYSADDSVQKAKGFLKDSMYSNKILKLEA